MRFRTLQKQELNFATKKCKNIRNNSKLKILKLSDTTRTEYGMSTNEIKDDDFITTKRETVSGSGVTIMSIANFARTATVNIGFAKTVNLM